MSVRYRGKQPGCAIARRSIGSAVADGDAGLTDIGNDIGNDFRLDSAAMTVFAIGLVFAIAGVLAAIAV
ncbi:hypothetical protein ACFVDI_08210 [Nocardioides sp. NPDC057767]|uniref:hypothetical protein n=1 Tax=unclassified Nocardioides TaxID=2615069 RepID=UPI00366B91B9